VTRTIKDKILASFKELSVQKGIKATTMDDLSAQAAISKRTLYKYFRSKEEIIENLFSKIMKDIDWQLNLVITGKGDPVYKFRSIIGLVSKNIESFQPVILDDLYKHYPHVWVKIENFRMSKQDFLESLIKEGIEQGYFRPLNAPLVSTGFIAMANVIVNPNFLADNELPANEALAQLAELFLYGVLHSRH